MIRRTISAILIVAGLAAMTVVPAAAQNGTDYEIEDVYLIREGSQRNFFIVEVYGNVRSNADGQEICETVGLDDLVGLNRYRSGGDRYTDVTCTGDEPLALTIEATVDGGIPYDADYDIYIADDLNDITGEGGSCGGTQVDDGIVGDDGVTTAFLPAGIYCVDVQEYEPDTIEDNIVFVIEFPAEDYILAEFNTSPPE